MQTPNLDTRFARRSGHLAASAHITLVGSLFACMVGVCLLECAAAVPAPWESADDRWQRRQTKIDPSSPNLENAVALESYSRSGGAMPYELRYGAKWQEPVMCGPNAIYALMRLKGLDVEYARVMELIAITAEGSTLADLSRVAEEFGLPNEIRVVSQQELREITPPFLAHEIVRTDHPEIETLGHFFVVTMIVDDTVHLIDGISGAIEETGMERLARSFTGYVLVPKPGLFGQDQVDAHVRRIMACAITGLLCLAIVWFYLRISIT